MSDEYLSSIGLDDVYVALILEDSASAYTADTPAYLAPSMELTVTPAVNKKTQYADDQAFDAQVSEGESALSLTFTYIDAETLATVTGIVFDSTTGRVYDNSGTPPYCALGFRSQKSNGEYRYFWFLKGRFDKPSDDYATKTDSPDPKPMKIGFTAIKTTYVFDLGDINDSVKRVFGDGDTTNFSATGWFSQVQYPSVASPSALALSSSSPADNDTDVVVTANISLVFNNVLKLGSENNVVLLDGSLAVVAAAASLSSDRKTITLDPTSSLSASTTYTVSYGVMDIYAQDLQGVFDFTTAA